ncbi:MAG: hypothetical protein HYY04_09825 [Chloroflexi bacterium]|nr:hypothetical protein [Chloroflexota bacterium]
MRIVEVEGFDWSACGGTHVGRTGSTGPIKIQRWERRGDETRVTFWCGWRALRDYGGKHALVRRLAEGMSVAEADLGTTLDRLLEEQRALRKTVAELRESLLGHEAERLLATAEVVDLSGVAIRLVVHALADRTPDDLKRLAQRLTAGPPAIALLGLGGGKAHLMFAQTPGLPTDLRPLLTAAGALIGGRGGGTRDLAQGGGPQADRIGEALRLARRTLVSEGGGAKGEE